MLSLMVLFLLLRCGVAVHVDVVVLAGVVAVVVVVVSVVR